jgi:hypothetical protein
LGDGVAGVDGVVAEVDDAEQVALVGQFGENSEVDLGLGRFDRDLVDQAGGELCLEGVAAGLLGACERRRNRSRCE